MKRKLIMLSVLLATLCAVSFSSALANTPDFSPPPSQTSDVLAPNSSADMTKLVYDEAMIKMDQVFATFDEKANTRAENCEEAVNMWNTIQSLPAQMNSPDALNTAVVMKDVENCQVNIRGSTGIENLENRADQSIVCQEDANMCRGTAEVSLSSFMKPGSLAYAISTQYGQIVPKMENQRAGPGSQENGNTQAKTAMVLMKNRLTQENAGKLHATSTMVAKKKIAQSAMNMADYPNPFA